MKGLEGSPDEAANLFHAPTIHAKIAISGSRGRSKANGSSWIVEQEFHIVDEPKEEAGDFVMQVKVILPYESGPRQRAHHTF